jgi:hypothetical protein
MSSLRKYDLLILSGSDPLPPKGGINFGAILQISYTEHKSPLGDIGVKQTNLSGLNSINL